MHRLQMGVARRVYAAIRGYTGELFKHRDADGFSTHYIFWRVFFFFFNDPAPTEIYTLPLPDALPISIRWQRQELVIAQARPPRDLRAHVDAVLAGRERGRLQFGQESEPRRKAVQLGGALLETAVGDRKSVV